MLKIRKIVLLLSLMMLSVVLYAQDKDPSLDLGINDIEGEETLKDRRKANKKKKKKNIFYGLKTRRAFFITGAGTRKEIISFRYLKTYKEPDPYVQEFYWFNPITGKVIESKNARREKELEKMEKANGKILHGPYQRKINDRPIEKGFYYVGVKHGRWEEFKKEEILKVKDSIEIPQQVLLKKDLYHKGWLKSYKITYHDDKKTIVHEVFPYNGDEQLNGIYFKFYQNGNLAEKGEYLNNKKIKVWEERFNNKRNTMKKQLKYPDKDDYEEDLEPEIMVEYGDDGKLLNGEEEVFDPIKKKRR